MHNGLLIWRLDFLDFLFFREQIFARKFEVKAGFVRSLFIYFCFRRLNIENVKCSKSSSEQNSNMRDFEANGVSSSANTHLPISATLSAPPCKSDMLQILLELKSTIIYSINLKNYSYLTDLFHLDLKV